MGDTFMGREEHDALVAALRERERQLEEAMQVGRIVPWEWHIEADVVTRAFDAKIFGPAPDNLGEFLEHMHPDDRPAVRSALRATLEHDAPYAVTYRRRVGDQICWFEARATLRRHADGRPEKLVGVAVEITQRKELELRLAQSHKMEAIGRLAGGIAHDLNNILTTIFGGAHLLQAEGRSDPQLVEEILQASNRAASLTHQLLAFSRRQLITQTVVDLARVADEVLALTRRTLGEDIEVEVDLGTGDLCVLGDGGQLTQVLLNLVINARDAMPSGGRLRIGIRAVSVDAAAGEHLALKPGDYVLLQVTDSGVGMDAATQARVFEPFFTTKALGRGTGLGLSTVYGTVKQSGGAVTVDSAPGQGTRFDVYLPRTTAQPKRVAPAAHTRVRAGAATVLLVEDDDSVRRIARTVLTQAGYRVTDAANGALGMAAAQLLESSLDLLLTDVVMPGLGGVALAQKLRDRSPGLAVLFMSGYTDDAMFRHGVVDSQVALLRKPFSPEALLAAVGNALHAGPS